LSWRANRPPNTFGGFRIVCRTCSTVHFDIYEIPYRSFTRNAGGEQIDGGVNGFISTVGLHVLFGG
jgi:hypothetical protein